MGDLLNWVLAEDEELREDNLIHCKSCGGVRSLLIEFYSSNKNYVRVPCECQVKKIKCEEEKEEQKRRLAEFNNRRRLSLIGERYKNIMFRNAEITVNNERVYEKMRRYVEHHKEMYANNIGLYIYGDNGTGKTYLTACLCNELVWVGEKCIYTNLSSILNEIRGSYDGNGIGECDMLNHLKYYDSAFIDDLGKEFIGREHNISSSKWAEEKLFEIINARYNSKKPTIFSSNYTIAELHDVLGLDKAIVDRINEMSTRCVKLCGDDFRRKEIMKSGDVARKFGI
jgi:DNA replication protein DnaC